MWPTNKAQARNAGCARALITGLRCRTRNADGWLADTRISYDTVAVSYADQLRDALARYPYLRGALALFADLVHAAGDFTRASAAAARLLQYAEHAQSAVVRDALAAGADWWQLGEHFGLRPQAQASLMPGFRVSRAYRKLHTSLQQACVFSGGMDRSASLSAPARVMRDVLVRPARLRRGAT
jgi:hypothetical protein